MVIPALCLSVGNEDNERLLCPVRALRYYLKATAGCRRGTDRLVVSHDRRKVGDVAPATIARWLVATIRSVYESASPDVRIWP